MRLTPREQDLIKKAFKKYFGRADHLWLFGSRADDLQKGGDIDLYIETYEPDAAKSVQAKIAFTTALWNEIGEQQIDIVLHLMTSNVDLPIYQIAKTTGAQLV